MKFLTWQNILILILLAALVFRECSRPTKIDLADQRFKDTIEILRQEKAVIQSRQAASVKVYKDKLKEDSLNLAVQDARINVFKSKLTNQRPKVIEKIEADTAVLSYVNTLEEVVTELQVQNDTLRSQTQFQRKLNEDLISIENIEDKVEASMQIEYTLRIADLEKSNKKKGRGNGFWKTVGAVLFGVVAVETILLVSDD